MARLPSAEDLGRRPVPTPSGGISRLNLSTPRQGAEAQAEVNFGDAVKGFGDTLGLLAAKEQQRLNEARTEDNYSQYDEGLLDLQYGKENGFANVLGGDAVKRPLVEDYRTRRETLAKGLRDGLDNDAQRLGFDNRVRIANRQFDARIYSHVAQQSRTYQQEVGEGVFATERTNASLNYAQPGQIEMSLYRTDREVERQAGINGISDLDVINNQKRIAGTMIHADVINQMMLQGKDSAAAAYYNGVRDQLTPEAMVLLGSKVKAANVDGEAIRGADTAWNILGPKDPNGIVRLDQIETVIRDRYKDHPEIMKAAIADVRSRAVAFKDGSQELKASNESKVLQAYHDGADLKTLQLMPEYTALDGEAKTKLRDYIVNNGWSEQQRARMQATYREGDKARMGFSAYWEASNPQVLNSMSEERIMQLEPTIGQELTADLLKAKRKLNDPANLKAATMDSELFNVVAADAGFKPYEKTQSPEQKEYLGRLKNNVETAIDEAQRAAGNKELNRTEKEALMRQIVDKKVMESHYFSSDKSIPAAAISPKQRKDVYVPIESVDSGFIKDAANFMRSTSIVPVKMEDKEILNNFKGRLQRAFALRITGGSSDEIKKALQGVDE